MHACKAPLEKLPPLTLIQKIILAFLPIDKKAGSLISGAQLLNAYREADEAGIAYEHFKAALTHLLETGHLEVTKRSYYKLTVFGEWALAGGQL